MAGIKELLGIGRSALMAQQQRMSTTQNNVANASTPGYRRKRSDLVSLGGQPGRGQLVGVHTREASVPRTFTSRQRSLARAERGQAQAQAQAMARLQGVLFPPGGSALESAMGELFGAARALEAAPADPTLRQDLLTRAGQLGAAFGDAGAALAREREGLGAEVRDRIASVNDTLSQIEALEESIGASRPGEALDLVDQRDQLAQEVAEAVGGEVFARADGTISVITRSGRALLEGGRARPVRVARQGDELQVLVGGGASEPAPLDPVEGHIGGLLAAHNQGIEQLESELDALAFEFAGAANAAHQAGLGLDGASGRDLFEVPAGPDGAARALRVSADVAGRPDLLGVAGSAAEVPGGNGALRALGALQDQTLPGIGEPPGQALAQASARFSSQIASARAEADVSGAALEHLEAVEASVTGVSLEEEMLSINETQNALQAAMRVLDATQEMFDAVLSLKT